MVKETYTLSEVLEAVNKYNTYYKTDIQLSEKNNKLVLSSRRGLYTRFVEMVRNNYNNSRYNI